MERDEYLWDKSGAPDPELERLERLLSRYAYEPQPEFAARLRGRPRTWRFAWIAAAAGFAAAALFAWRTWFPPPSAGYRLIGVEGRARLHAGDEFTNESASAKRVELGWLGHIDVDPGAVLRVEDCGTLAHRLFLERGVIEARITAEPRVFQIGTPAGSAVDLGCAYRLEVDAQGVARLRVSVGQVAFEFDGREVYVPAGASCSSRPGHGPRAPVFDSASQEFKDALEAIEFAAVPDPKLLDVVLHQGEIEDTLSLWHLYDGAQTSALVRQAVFERLLQVVPKPIDRSNPSQVVSDAQLQSDPLAGKDWMERMKPRWKIE